MNAEKYPVTSSDDHCVFEFLSEGPNGTIKKIVLYERVTANLFNLAFGDWDDKALTLLDTTRSNNEDRDKVLATVAFTVFEFMDNHPNAIVLAQGSTPSRTRLYQMGIKISWKEFALLFSVKGLKNGTWADFELNENYDAFSLSARRKT